LYRDGICVEKNINKANILLIQASYYGNDLAKFVLAINYVHGNNGFTKNRKKAVEILTELKDKGNLPAKVSLESLKLD
jgi:TPR repeat protein